MVSPISVVIVETGSREAVETTRRSLARQTILPPELTDVADVAALRRAIDEGHAPFVAIVRAGTILFPGALAALHAALSAEPNLSLADALALQTDARGDASQSGARAQVLEFRRHAPQTPTAALPTFRREALRAGPLDGSSVEAAVQGAVRHVTDRHGARLLQDVLCARPSPGVNVKRRRPPLGSRIRTALYRVQTARMWGPVRRWPKPYEVLSALARLTTRRAQHATRARAKSLPSGESRIAYVLWRYPMRSETFIRREIQALRGAGISIEVLALEPDSPPLPPDPASPAGAVTYFGPASRSAGQAALLASARRRPWAVLQVWLGFVAHRRTARLKTWRGDLDELRLAAQLASALARHGITHVHAPWANHYALVASAAARMVGATFTVQARASEIHRGVESSAVADRVRHAQFLITNSRYNEHLLRRTLGEHAPPVHVVYNGVEVERFEPRPDDVSRQPEGCRLLAVGRLIEPKGFRYLLEACARLRGQGLSFRCDIIGGTAYPDTVTPLELRMLMSDLALDGVVCFRGPLSFSDVLEAYRRADIFVLPCVRARDGSHDITPNSLIEAMAMSLPVVSTASGAIPEIVDHERTGLLVAPGDARSLEQALHRLMTDAPLRRRLGCAARRTIEERFDIATNVKARMALFAGAPPGMHVDRAATCGASARGAGTATSGGAAKSPDC